jgi:hypothetical protein
VTKAGLFLKDLKFHYHVEKSLFSGPYPEPIEAIPHVQTLQDLI